ncbi:MAG: thymidine phosphorylase [Armatimonadota bacterium]|nr:thymidine phosphorylase [Armatimonadota bacterium]MDR7532735.1 thymidine phosphorylase [Armatimonadota bacterium]
MRALDLIRSKRDGAALTPTEIAYLVDGFTRGEIPDYQMAAFLMAVYFRGMTAEETAALTLAMVRSGTTLDLGALAARAVDKHSSGGVGDKTSLVLVPLVASADVPVAKLSGRGLGHTGGTLDKLEAIPGVRTALSDAEVVAQVMRVGCVIAGQSHQLVPADQQLYALRDVTATVDSIPLIAASIMSKKIAGGARGIVLDVKCGRGAFMKTEAAARALASAMVEIGAQVGRRTVAVLSAMDAPLGRAVGNALEVREAVEALTGRGPADLMDLCFALGGWMLVLGGRATTPEEGQRLLQDRLAGGAALEKFVEMVTAQGGEEAVARDPRRLPQAPIRAPVPAPAAGWIAAIDAEVVGLAVMRLGAGRARKEDRVDPAVGVVLERVVGDPVTAGDVLAVVHARTEEAAAQAVREVAAAYALGSSSPAPGPLVLGVLGPPDG